MTDIFIVPWKSLQLVSDHGKFFKVKTEDGREGFIRWKYIKEQDRLIDVTKKAIINRNDGKGNFIKLRETPEQSSDFMDTSDLPNGTIVDILEENAE